LQDNTHNKQTYTKNCHMIEQRLFTTPQTETTSDDYYTPKWIFDTLGLHFDLDVHHHHTQQTCHVTATSHSDDGTQTGTGEWMNPPFSPRWLQHGNGGLTYQHVVTGMWRRNASRPNGNARHTRLASVTTT
jgi:hypothetical protein